MSASHTRAAAKLTLAAALLLTAAGTVACTSPSAPAPPTVAVDGSVHRDVAAVLAGDPRFSDFVIIIRSVGLGHELNSADGITIFAPTNDAFDRSYPNWANVVNPDLSSPVGGATFARQRLVRAAALQGVHMPDEFAGRRQDVMTIGGTVFVVDGTTAGRITLSIPTSDRAGMGFPTSKTPPIATLGPPIRATNGIIYPADAVIVH